MAKPLAKPLVLTLYRELQRSCRRCRAVMRPAHVTLIGDIVQRFAESGRSPSLATAIKEHGPLPLPGLVRHAFRNCGDGSELNPMIDDAFRALRLLHSVEEWVTTSARTSRQPLFSAVACLHLLTRLWPVRRQQAVR